jgi:hypothetical protein
MARRLKGFLSALLLIQAKQGCWIVGIRPTVFLMSGGGMGVTLSAGSKETRKKVLEVFPLPEKSYIFSDAMVLLGTPDVNQTHQPVRLVGYSIDGITYWIATDRFDLTAEQVADVYKLRWDIEKFFGWWKKHLNVYHLFARSKNGLMVQILSGLITYLLLSIYCHEKHRGSVSIARVRQLRSQIRNEALQQASAYGAKRKRCQRQRRRRENLYASS